MSPKKKFKTLEKGNAKMCQKGCFVWDTIPFYFIWCQSCKNYNMSDLLVALFLVLLVVNIKRQCQIITNLDYLPKQVLLGVKSKIAVYEWVTENK